MDLTSARHMTHLGRFTKQLLRSLRSPATWLLALTTFLYLFVVVPYWKPTWDSATYISLARALVQGDGYTYMGYPHLKYPPGFPLLLAPIELVFGHHYLLMRLLIAGCAVGSVGGTYLLLRQKVGIRAALGISTMVAGSYALLLEATRILSDVPYMLVSIAAILVAERYQERLSRRTGLQLMALILVTYSIRLVGFALAFAVAAALLSNVGRHSLRVRAKHAALVVAAMVVVMGLWMGRNALVTEHLPAELREALSYERELIVTNPSDPHSSTVRWESMIARLRQNVKYYEQLHANLLTSRHAQNATVVHVLSLLWVVGWGIACYRRRGVLEYYTFFYVWIYLLWPSLQGERFLVPILPMLFYYTLLPLFSLLEWASQIQQEASGDHELQTPTGRWWLRLPHFGRIAKITLWMLPYVLVTVYIQLSVAGVTDFIRQERQEPYYRGETAEYIEAIQWVRDHTPPNTVIITDRAPWAYLLSDRHSYTSPWVDDADEVLSSIERNGGTHIIANDWGYSGRYLKPVIANHPALFAEVHRIGGNVIYEFGSGGEARK